MKPIFFILVLISSAAFAWEGYDPEHGVDVEIDKGNLVRPGRDIEIYDSGSEAYKDVEVESIHSYGSTTEVEVYDYESDEYRTLEMD